ncbi:hypothetical protein Vafri_8950, partial [Volvox africanus]
MSACSPGFRIRSDLEFVQRCCAHRYDGGEDAICQSPTKPTSAVKVVTDATATGGGGSGSGAGGGSCGSSCGGGGGGGNMNINIVGGRLLELTSERVQGIVNNLRGFQHLLPYNFRGSSSLHRQPRAWSECFVAFRRMSYCHHNRPWWRRRHLTQRPQQDVEPKSLWQLVVLLLLQLLRPEMLTESTPLQLQLGRSVPMLTRTKRGIKTALSALQLGVQWRRRRIQLLVVPTAAAAAAAAVAVMVVLAAVTNAAILRKPPPPPPPLRIRLQESWTAAVAAVTLQKAVA